MYVKLFVGILGLIISMPVQAHVGDHGAGSFLLSVFHFLSEPLHVGVLLVVTIPSILWLRASRLQRLSKVASPRC